MQADRNAARSRFAARPKLGSWTLVRTARSAGKDWLLIKHRDEHAGRPPPGFEEERSVVSGRTVEEVAAGRSATAVGVGREAPYPSRLEPMLATLFARPFTNADWLFEPKLDGVRAIAFLPGGRSPSAAVARSTRQYPAIAEGSRPSNRHGLTAIVPWTSGESPLRAPAAAHALSRTEDIAHATWRYRPYYAFDLLHLDATTKAPRGAGLLWSAPATRTSGPALPGPRG
jgi:bifunctional non-homologous end joining protein LigD